MHPCHRHLRNRFPRIVPFIVPLVALVLAVPARGDGDHHVTFEDIATDPASGLAYARHASPREAIAAALRLENPFTLGHLIVSPDSSRGLPGTALLDADGDGDLDIYVTNGPGAPNSLFLNRLRDRGGVTFVDRALESGVAAIDQDSTGVCAGDLDNDGDPELLVLGSAEPNRLFENLGTDARGRVTFADVTGASGLADPETAGLTAASCAFGDVDGDGLLDIAIANAYDLIDRRAIIVEPFALSQPNQLLRNRGDLTFEDVSASSGILELDLPPAAPAGAATITWVMVLVDLDLDGDLDLVQADDHGALPFSVNGGIDRGFIQVFENDGAGRFTNVTFARGLGVANGDWMGLALGDFDRNGHLDFFATNLGNHSLVALLGLGYPVNEQRDSRAFLQQADGSFLDTSPDGALHNPFGWGTSAFDLENDGDLDLVYHGGFDFGILVGATPGVILRGDGAGGFSRDLEALAGSSDHLRRNVRGMAIGDLDGNGFDDIVSVSNFDYPEPIPLTALPPLGGEFDHDAAIVATFTALDPTLPPILSDHLWNGIAFPDGSLSVELNRGESGHRSVQVELIGSAGLTAGGRASRQPFGAVVAVTPAGGTAQLRPLLGGSSMASQDSPVLTFGLGTAARARIDVYWPGGARNRFWARAGQRLELPEIPCRFDDPALALGSYLQCVTGALHDLVDAGVLGPSRAGRLVRQSLRAWHSAH